jgi:uncharacterized protein YcgI (DUF1989 family)
MGLYRRVVKANQPGHDEIIGDGVSKRRRLPRQTSSLDPRLRTLTQTISSTTMATKIPARTGAHFNLKKSQRIKIINPSGNQVVDFWAFPFNKQPTWMSMAQTRSKLMKLRPAVDDILFDTRRGSMLKIVEDSTAGVHDMVFPPCDKWRYTEANIEGHDSCGGNLRTELSKFVSKDGDDSDEMKALRELESTIQRWEWTPEPFNIFMNVQWSGDDGQLQVNSPNCKANDFVVLEALSDCLVVLSACPNDLLDTNGGRPGPAAVHIIDK